MYHRWIDERGRGYRYVSSPPRVARCLPASRGVIIARAAAFGMLALLPFAPQLGAWVRALF